MPRIQCPNCAGTGYIRVGLISQPCDLCGTQGHVESRADQPPNRDNGQKGAAVKPKS